MTGRQVKITVDNKAVRLAYIKLGDGRWAMVALKQIGEKLLKSTNARVDIDNLEPVVPLLSGITPFWS